MVAWSSWLLLLPFVLRQTPRAPPRTPPPWLYLFVTVDVGAPPQVWTQCFSAVVTVQRMTILLTPTIYPIRIVAQSFLVGHFLFRSYTSFFKKF